MMYPFMTLNDHTEIVFSNIQPEGRVKIYIETPDEKYCFRHATYWLPDNTWEDIYHFSKNEIKNFEEIIRPQFHLIMKLSQEKKVNATPLTDSLTGILKNDDACDLDVEKSNYLADKYGPIS